jgi:ABC-type Fe3+-hydroxamate transport system substrate-binding protein
VPSLSETLWWWHLADRLVGVTDWCVAPPSAYTAAVRVRGTKNPDVTTIVELAPDLVIANDEENRELDVQRLREAGVEVYVTRVRGVEDAAGSLARLGEALGVGRAGAGLAQSIERAVDQLAAPSRQLRVFCPVWRDGPPTEGTADDEVWWATGRATFAGDLLGHVGLDVLPTDPRRVATRACRWVRCAQQRRTWSCCPTSPTPSGTPTGTPSPAGGPGHGSSTAPR